jgi:hypothetical protein
VALRLPKRTRAHHNQKSKARAKVDSTREGVTNTRNRLRYRGKSSKLERRFELLWRILNGPELVREFQFHPERKWRVDFAHIPSRTLIEIEGGIWIQGRHNRGAGFITDIGKYNEATFSGWRVFRLADVHLKIEVVGRLRAIC